MAVFRNPYAHTVRMVFAVSAFTLLPTLSWQFLDARSSATVAAPVAAIAARQQSVIRKSMLTWSHTKSDRLLVATRLVQETARNESFDAPTVQVPSAKADREPPVPAKPKVDAGQFSEWLVPEETGIATARIIDFAARRSNINRKTCRAHYDDIISAFSISQAHVMADRPVMFQSTICAANGEIVITCFGTNATVSPRKTRPGSRCRKHS